MSTNAVEAPAIAPQCNPQAIRIAKFARRDGGLWIPLPPGDIVLTPEQLYTAQLERHRVQTRHGSHWVVEIPGLEGVYVAALACECGHVFDAANGWRWS